MNKIILAALMLVGVQTVSAEIIREDFNSLADVQSSWDISAWGSTLHQYSPDNVTVDNGTLVLKLNASPAGTIPIGGEITYNKRKFLYGSYRASIKTTNVPGSVIGWFVYKDGVPGDGNLHEVDFEILTRQPQKMWLTLHHDAYSVASTTYNVTFNPWEAFHEYRYDWYKDSVVYFIDGARIKSLTRKVPDDSTAMMLNHWSKNQATWGGDAPLEDTYMYVDYVEYRSLDEIEPTTPTLSKPLQWGMRQEDGYLSLDGLESPMSLSLLDASGAVLVRTNVLGRQRVDLRPWQNRAVYAFLSGVQGQQSLRLR